ncbi:MAG: molecular chaperone DjlA [Bacteroidetes bacterium]|nr:molecular chaperone DjlA [Bacteroidota bacterium]
MGSFARWIGGGLGALAGGPLGAVLGFLIGTVIDNTRFEVHGGRPAYGPTTPGGFGMSLLVLIAAVMKADGRVLRSELDFVKQFFTRQFGPDSATDALQVLRDILKQEIPLRDVCSQIAMNMDYSSRLQLIHMLFGVSAADGRYDEAELKVIGRISEYLNIAGADYMSIRNMFVPETDSSYKILEIERIATDEEVKKAYRRMAMKYHPDKVSHLGEDFRKDADEKFKKVNEAYKRIKKERNMA